MSREERLSREILNAIRARRTSVDNSEEDGDVLSDDIDDVQEIEMKIAKVSLGSKSNSIKPITKCSVSFDTSLSSSESPFILMKPVENTKSTTKRLRKISLKIDASNGKAAGKAALIFISDSKSKSKDIMKSIAHRKFPARYTEEDFTKEKDTLLDTSNEDRRKTCAMCNEAFTSRTRLFQHIRDSGHEVDTPGTSDTANVKPHALVVFDEEGKGSTVISKADAQKMPPMRLIMIVPVPSDVVVTSIHCLSDAGDDENAVYASRRHVPSDKTVQVKEIGLNFLSSLLSSIDPNKQHGCLDAVTKSAHKLLSKQNALSMYSDWTPPRLPPVVEIPLAPSEAYAAGTSGVSNNPERALTSDGYWKSTDCKASSSSSIYWGIRIVDPVPLVAFHLVFEETCWPEEIQVQVSYPSSSSSKKQHSSSSTVFRSVAVVDEATIQEERVIYLNSPSSKPVQYVQFVFRGKARSNSANVIALRNVVLFSAASSRQWFSSSSSLAHTNEKLYAQPRQSLCYLEMWLEKVSGSNEPSLAMESVMSLKSLALSSGSLTSILRLVKVLLTAPPSLAVNPAFTDNLSSAMLIQSQGVIEKEDKASRAWPSNISCKSAFDPTACTPGINISQDGMRVNYTLAEASGSTHAHALLNVGFTHGQATWWMKLEEDTNSQTTCFGIAIRPVLDSSYDHSKQLWMYRAYNGNLYARGKLLNNKKFKKVCKGDIVKADLDMFAGTLSFTVNDEFQGVAFTDLCGLHIFPAVTFYGEKRSVTLIDCKSTAVVCHHLCNMKEIDSQVGWGQVGKATWLGYDGNDGMKTISVADKPVQYGLSMYPPLGGYAYIEYELGGVYECLNVAVALNDDIKSDETAKVVFEVYGDGELLWKSPIVSVKGKSVATEIKLLDVKVLQLRVRDLNTEKPNANGVSSAAHAIWSVANVEFQTMYRRWYRNVFTNSILYPENSLATLSMHENNNDPHLAAASLLHKLARLSLTFLLPMRNFTEPPKSKNQLSQYDLESPFAVQVCPETFHLCCILLKILLPTLSTSASPGDTANAIDPEVNVPPSEVKISMVDSILQIMKVNIRRMIVSYIDPKEAGLRADSDILTSINEVLNSLISHDSIPSSIQQQAVEVLDEALPLLAPKVSTRAAMFLDSIPSVRVIEFQFRWPALTHQAVEYANLERAMLIIQLECRKRKWRGKLIGRWMGFVYFVTELPGDVKVEDFLGNVVTTAFATAGYKDWVYPTGMKSPHIHLKLEKHVDWNRVRRLSHEPGVGVVRLYTNELSKKPHDQIFDAVTKNIASHVGKN
jgi:hypothetical protein